MEPKIGTFVKNYHKCDIEGVEDKKVWKDLYHNKSVRVKKKTEE